MLQKLLKQQSVAAGKSAAAAPPKLDIVGTDSFDSRAGPVLEEEPLAAERGQLEADAAVVVCTDSAAVADIAGVPAVFAVVLAMSVLVEDGPVVLPPVLLSDPWL